MYRRITSKKSSRPKASLDKRKPLRDLKLASQAAFQGIAVLYLVLRTANYVSDKLTDITRTDTTKSASVLTLAEKQSSVFDNVILDEPKLPTHASLATLGIEVLPLLIGMLLLLFLAIYLFFKLNKKKDTAKPWLKP